MSSRALEIHSLEPVEPVKIGEILRAPHNNHDAFKRVLIGLERSVAEEERLNAKKRIEAKFLANGTGIGEEVRNRVAPAAQSLTDKFAEHSQAQSLRDNFEPSSVERRIWDARKISSTG